MKSLRIVIIEDEKPAARLLERKIEKLGQVAFYGFILVFRVSRLFCRHYYFSEPILERELLEEVCEIVGWKGE